MAAPIVIPANALLEVRIIGFLDAQQCITTFWYLIKDGIPDLVLASPDIGDDFEDQVWTPALQLALSSEYQDVYFEVQVVRPIRYRSSIFIPALRAGALGGLCLPSGVSVVVRRSTPVAGRRFQGRIYLPGIQSSAVSDSGLTAAWLAAHQANIVAAMKKTLNRPTFGDLVPVVYHPGPVGITDEVTISTVDPIIRYQRRRELGVGA